ncbi:hypothetical protein K502DRAFT_362071 [Neoconidiobolus thromboides FSU 785]|nr:hypothetical protein K502DRAFT_362071 [Neoconidiobolus thromboides FSU 785]
MTLKFLSPENIPKQISLEDEIVKKENTDKKILDGKVVTPGDVITTDLTFMRGFGTYKDGDCIRSSVAGTVGVLNKLITATSLRARYSGEIGDVVVARITEVSQKRWKVDVNSRQDGILLLSSVILPGGVQRRKSESDELKMRQLLSEGDLLVAEVHAFYGDAISLHTRSIKYGKLRNGCLVQIPPLLVQRSRSHFALLSCGVNVIFGLNGYIWVSKYITDEIEEISEDNIFSSKNEDITDTERETIARVANCIRALSISSVPVSETSVNFAYEASLQYDTKELLITSFAQSVAYEALEKTAMINY